MVRLNQSFFVRVVIDYATCYGQRLGQALFNMLSVEATEKLVGNQIDPFYSVTNRSELFEWVDNHLILDDEATAIAIFSGDEILWEAK